MNPVENPDLWGLFGSAFVSATLFPGGSEVVFVWLLREGAHSPTLLLAIAAAGNSLGGMSSWLVGRLLPRDRLLADDKRRRYRVDGDKPKTKNGSYSLRIEPDGFAFGWCMSFKEGQTHSWHSKTTRKMSKEDRAAFKAKATLAKQQREAEAKAANEAARARASGMWAKASTTGASDYLMRKGIEAHGVRFMKDIVVVPMRGGCPSDARTGGRIRGTQPPGRRSPSTACSFLRA